MMMMRVGVSQSGTVDGKNPQKKPMLAKDPAHVGSTPTPTSLLSQPPEKQDIFTYSECEHKELCLT